MNVSGSGSTNSSSSSKGLSGLMSGIDTEKMVEQMLANTQSKIDKQNGIKQQIIWKQEMYRSIISSVNIFKSKYFDSASKTNFLSSAFFNSMVAAGGSTAFKVTAGSTSTEGDTTLKVDRLASNTKLVSGSPVSGKLEGNLNLSALQNAVDVDLAAARTVDFQVDSQVVTVDFTDVFVDSSGNYTTLSEADRAAAVVDKINTAFSGAGISGVSASVSAGNISIKNTDTANLLSVKTGTAEGLAALGMTEGSSGTVGGSSQTLKGKYEMQPSLTLNVALDDNSKQIKLAYSEIIDSTGTVRANLIGSEMQSAIASVHGTGQIGVTMSGTGFELTVSAGRKVGVTGDLGTLGAFGLKNGQSNKIGVGGKLSDLYFAAPLQGTEYKFSINGVNFSFNENSVMNDIMSQINASGADVRMVYRATDDKFVLESTKTGAGHDIVLEQQSGNFLGAVFGSGPAGTLTTGTSATSKTLVRNTLVGPTVLTSGEFAMTDGKFIINVNGATHSITVNKKADSSAYTQAELTAEINRQLGVTFGANAIEIRSDGSLKTGYGYHVTFSGTETSANMTDAKDKANAGDLALAFGFALDGGMSNIAVGTDTLADVGLGAIGGFAASTKLEDLTGELEFKDGRIIYTPTAPGSGLTVGTPAEMQRLFGMNSLDLGISAGAAAQYTAGENALVEIDGVATERSSNAFTVNGMTIELKSVTTGTETIKVSRGTDDIVDGIKSFIEDYNKLIDELNTTINADATYKKYPPLTEAQKKEMTTREIELWEEKSREGLLKGDSTIGALLAEMRSVLYTKPAGCDYAIYNIGIDTSSDWRDNGKLVMDADGEARLRSVIETNAEEVMKLFTAAGDGISAKMSATLTSAANTSSGNPGSLVRIAGLKGKASDANNDLSKRLQDIETKIANLKRSYESEKARYWKQFNAMETAMARFNSQSEWLYNQFNMQ